MVVSPAIASIVLAASLLASSLGYAEVPKYPATDVGVISRIDTTFIEITTLPPFDPPSADYNEQIHRIAEFGYRLNNRVASHCRRLKPANGGLRPTPQKQIPWQKASLTLSKVAVLLSKRSCCLLARCRNRFGHF